jgi:MYXO-CTERM domain-containing protein
MKKFAAFGIACLLATASYSIAGKVNHDNSDNKCDPKNDCHPVVTFSFDNKVDLSDDCNTNLDLSPKCDTDKTCKIDWKEDKCSDRNGDLQDCNKDKDCKDSQSDDCHKDCKPTCDPGNHGCESVPAPASAALGGVGVAGVILANFIRRRRSAKA